MGRQEGLGAMGVRGKHMSVKVLWELSITNTWFYGVNLEKAATLPECYMAAMRLD